MDNQAFENVSDNTVKTKAYLDVKFLAFESQQKKTDPLGQMRTQRLMCPARQLIPSGFGS